jgi:hypothetical protein
VNRTGGSVEFLRAADTALTLTMLTELTQKESAHPELLGLAAGNGAHHQRLLRAADREQSSREPCAASHQLGHVTDARVFTHRMLEVLDGELHLSTAQGQGT